MIFPCPKCEARTELNASTIPEDGTSAKCPECNTRFWITKDTFARRAIKKEGKSFCYFCNNELSNYLDCPTCGAMYPDFCVVQLAKPVKKKKRKSSSSISFSIRPQRISRSTRSEQQTTQRASKPLLTAVVALVLAALLIAAIAIPYFNSRAEKQYTASYMYALYGIKSGVERNIKTCSLIAADGKARVESGRNFEPRTTPEEQVTLAKIKEEIDRSMTKAAKPPVKFGKQHEQLGRLYDSYTKSYSLAVSPSGSLPAFTDNINKLDSEFKQRAQELKAGMPAEMSAALNKAKVKYRGLQDF